MLRRLTGVWASFRAAESKNRWLRRKLANRLARRPIAAAWAAFEKRLPVEQMINEEFDRRYGTDTAGEVALAEAGVSPVAAAHGQNVYRPVWESSFHDALAGLGIRFEGFTFVDIGSGKGKALMMASNYPFARIVGVEYSPDLHACAVRNLALYHSPHQQCMNLVAVRRDALAYRLPLGSIVCMLFNPFDSETMGRFVRHVEGELADRDTPAYLLYVNLRNVAEMGDGFDGIRKLRRLIKTPNVLVFGNEAASRHRQATTPRWAREKHSCAGAARRPAAP